MNFPIMTGSASRKPRPVGGELHFSDRRVRDSEDKKVQGCAALKNLLVFQKGMTADSVELLQKKLHLFKHVQPESGVFCLVNERFKNQIEFL